MLEESLGEHKRNGCEENCYKLLGKRLIALNCALLFQVQLKIQYKHISII